MVHVDSEIDEAALTALRAGLVRKDGATGPAQVSMKAELAWPFPRDPPMRFGQSILTR